MNLKMKNQLAYLIPAILALFIFWGCASQKRISSNQTQFDNLKREIKFYKDQNSQLRREIDTLKKDLSEMGLSNRQDKADLTAQIDEVRQKLDALQNLLQDTNYRISDLNQRSPSRDIFEPIDQNTSSPDDTSAGSQIFPVDSSRELYNTAYRDLIRGNYQLALSGFRQFVRQYPNSDLTGKAQYWIGEVFYAQGRYLNAIEEFEKVVRRYRNNDKNASALLKIGYAYFNIDEIEQGKIYLEEVVQQHPDSEEANLAKGRLASLNE